MRKAICPILCILLLSMGFLVKGQPITAISNPVYINFGMPELALDSEIIVNDPNNNNTLDANERFMVSFFIKNKGNYVANRVEVKTKVSDPNSGLILPGNEELGNIAPEQRQVVKRVIVGGPDLKSGVAELEFQIFENDSLTEVVTHKVKTYSISRKPRLEIIAHDFFSLEEGKTIKPDSEFELRIRLKNTGGGVAQEVQFDILHNKHILLLSDLKEMMISELPPNEVVEKRFKFYLGVNYKDTKIPIRVKVFDINEGSGELQELSDAIVDK
ncbi:MAG: hypothetical protein AAF694_09115 [Bacteroidota bacterium]